MPDLMEPPIGAILAGGRSLRMGRDKAAVSFRGRLMVDHVADALTQAGCEPVIIGRAEGGRTRSIKDDPARTTGPAAGLATALRIAEGRDVFLAATDQPLLRPETVVALLEVDGAAVVPVDAGARQTTCAVYRAACLEPLSRLMETRSSIALQGLLDTVPPREVPESEWALWGEDGRSWWSLDNPRDVTRAEQWLAARRDRPG